MQQCDTTMYIPKLRLGSLVVFGSIGYTTTSSCASSLFYAKKAQQHCQIEALGCGATLAATQLSDGTYFRVLVFRLGINRPFSCGNGTKDENYFKAGLRCDGTSPYTHPHLGRCGSLRLCLAPQAATPCTTPPTHRSIPLLDRSRLARRYRPRTDPLDSIHPVRVKLHMGTFARKGRQKASVTSRMHWPACGGSALSFGFVWRSRLVHHALYFATHWSIPMLGRPQLAHRYHPGTDPLDSLHPVRPKVHVGTFARKGRQKASLTSRMHWLACGGSALSFGFVWRSSAMTNALVSRGC